MALRGSFLALSTGRGDTGGQELRKDLEEGTASYRLLQSILDCPVVTEAPDRCEPCLLSLTMTTECSSLIFLDVMGGCNGTKLLLEPANLKGKVLLWDVYICVFF